MYTRTSHTYTHMMHTDRHRVTVTMYVRNDKAAKKEQGARSQPSQARKSQYLLFFHLYRISPRADPLIFFTEYCPITGSCRGPICSWYIGIYSHFGIYSHTHTHAHTHANTHTHTHTHTHMHPSHSQYDGNFH